MWAHKTNIYKLCPYKYIMVYHEVRIKGNHSYNYIIHNAREDGKWKKKSKFIGNGRLSKKKIEEIKNKFNAYLSKGGKSLDENFREWFFTELTYNSNSIEGNSMSLEETNLVVNENIAPEGKTLREINEAKNHIKALEFIKNYKGDFSEEFVLKLHSIILKDISERFSGKYRQTQVRIFGSDVKFPNSEKVPQLIKNLIYWYKKNKKKYHQFELATLVSMKFVTIHPFIDGNGRVSRLIMNFLLQKRNYPWINIYTKQREQYIKSVRKANDEDYSSIIPFLMNSLKENLKDFGFY